MSPEPDHLAHVQQNFVRHILPLRGFVLALLARPDLADDSGGLLSAIRIMEPASYSLSARLSF